MTDIGIAAVEVSLEIPENALYGYRVSRFQIDFEFRRKGEIPNLSATISNGYMPRCAYFVLSVAFEPIPGIQGPLPVDTFSGSDGRFVVLTRKIPCRTASRAGSTYRECIRVETLVRAL